MSFARKDYTARDFDSIVEQTKAYITAKYPTLVMDFSDNSMSIESVILDIVAYIGDALHLYIDAGVSEAFVDTAAERDSLTSLGKLVGYAVGKRAASVADLTYTYTKLDPGAPNSITLTKGTAVKCSEGFKWAVASADQTVSLAGSGGTFAVKQGVFVTDTFTATTAVNQRYTSSRQKVASNVSVVVTVDGVDWTEVTTLIDQGAGQYYELHWNGDGSFYVRFGDGTDGDIPTNAIVFSYFLSDGQSGNVSANTINGSFNPHAQVLVTYNNDAASSGGVDSEAIDEARRNLPAYSAAQGRLVSYTDYKGVVEAWSGIKYADIEFDSVLRKLVCYVMSDSYGAVSDATLAELDRYMRDRHQLLSSIIFKNVDFINALVSLTVALDSSPKYELEDKKEEIEDVIEAFFEPGVDDPEYNKVGKDVYLSDFIRVVDEVDGVNHVTVKIFTREPQLRRVTWSEAVGSISLDGWYLRPSVRIQQTPSRGHSMSAQIAGTGSLAGQRVYQQQKISRIFTTASSPASGTRIERVAGARWVASDWILKASVVPAEIVKLTMSSYAGRYAWGSWYNTDDGTLPTALVDRILDVSEQTGHFIVSHVLDGVEYPETCIGYVGRIFELDSSSFMFSMTASTSAVAAEALSTTVLGGGYTEGTCSNRILVPGSVSGVITYSLHPAASYSDDGYGGLLDNRGVQIGYIDYDQGYFLFDTSRMLGSVLAYTARYSYYVFPNVQGEKAELLISPFVGDIPVDRREFCVLSQLSLEVSYE